MRRDGGLDWASQKEDQGHGDHRGGRGESTGMRQGLCQKLWDPSIEN